MTERQRILRDIREQYSHAEYLDLLTDVLYREFDKVSVRQDHFRRLVEEHLSPEDVAWLSDATGIE